MKLILFASIRTLRPFYICGSLISFHNAVVKMQSYSNVRTQSELCFYPTTARESRDVQLQH